RARDARGPRRAARVGDGRALRALAARRARVVPLRGRGRRRREPWGAGRCPAMAPRTVRQGRQSETEWCDRMTSAVYLLRRGCVQIMDQLSNVCQVLTVNIGHDCETRCATPCRSEC